MHISSRLALLAGLAGLAIAAPAAMASPTKAITTDTPNDTWTSAPGSGLNTSYFLDGTAGQKGACGADLNNACDTTLVHVTATDIGDGSVKFRIEGFDATSDYDIRVYESDATGTLGTKIGSPNGDVGADDPRHTGPGDYETTNAPLGAYIDPETATVDAWFAIVVPYFTVVNDTYTGKAELTQSAPVVEESGE